MKDAVAAGLVHPTGLIAHGRGEAFDYLLGEATTPEAEEAVAEAARRILAAKRPVLSLNGNVVALAAEACLEVRRALPRLVLEVNVFHRGPGRVERLVAAMEAAGAPPGSVLGAAPDARIPGLESDRALCCSAGIGGADVVVVPLEDGDRCEALKAMGKTVVTIELNPLTRTARAADVTIVDELTRALPRLAAALRAGAGDAQGQAGHAQGRAGHARQARSPGRFDNADLLRRVRQRMAARLRA